MGLVEIAPNGAILGAMLQFWGTFEHGIWSQLAKLTQNATQTLAKAQAPQHTQAQATSVG